MSARHQCESQHVAPRCTLRNSRAAAAVADSDAPEVGAAGAMPVLVFVLAAVAVTSVVDPRL